MFFVDTQKHKIDAIRVMYVLTKHLKLQSRDFRYKVALYLSYLHIKFDDEIKGNPSNFKHKSRFV